MPLDEQLPAGPWHARIRLQRGLTKRAAEATITFPLSTGAAESVKAETDLSYHPIAALVIGVILSALMARKVLMLRRNAVRPAPTSDEPHCSMREICASLLFATDVRRRTELKKAGSLIGTGLCPGWS